MLYNLNWLSPGQIFPPREEIKRLDAYRANDMLLNDEPWAAMPSYKDRVMYLLSNFALAERDVYLYNANYWSDLAEKTKELIFGNPPDVTAGADEQGITDIMTETEFIEKAKEGVGDFVAMGDWVTKIIERDGKTTFINVDPATWFPVVSRENVKEVRYHVLAWIVDGGNNRFELHVQIHEKGKYQNRAFAIKSYNPDSYFTDKTTNRNIAMPTYELGLEVKQAADGFILGEFPTGLEDFAVISSANNARTRSIYGVSDFDMITDSCMEYNVRMVLKNVVLDKHSAPTMYGPPLEGDDYTDTGNYITCPPDNAMTPGYLTWDASMSAVLSTIDTLKEDTANLSGMGSILSNKTFGESQGYDALMIKLAPALMRAAGKKTVLEKHIKKLLSLLSVKYGKPLMPDEITVTWHDGIPTTESIRADIAQKHLSTGWSKKRVLMIDYGMTEEEAESEIEQARNETPAMPAFGIGEDDGEQEEGEDNGE